MIRHSDAAGGQRQAQHKPEGDTDGSEQQRFPEHGFADLRRCRADAFQCAEDGGALARADAEHIGDHDHRHDDDEQTEKGRRDHQRAAISGAVLREPATHAGRDHLGAGCDKMRDAGDQRRGQCDRCEGPECARTVHADLARRQFCEEIFHLKRLPSRPSGAHQKRACHRRG